MLSHYEILGVRSSAGPADIRAAYIELMKRYHPDAVGSDPAAASRAGQVNRAYAILRDPEQRAMHDAELRILRDEEERRIYAAFAPYPPASRKKPLGKQPVAVLLALAFLAAVGFFFDERPDFIAALSPEEMLFGPSEDETGMMAATPSATPAGQDPVDYANVSDAVADFDWIATQSQISGAETFSRQCFAEMKIDPSYRLFDRCAAFDLAVGFWNASTAGKYGTPLNPFFSPEVREERHRRALRTISADQPRDAARLNEIEKNTISAMADRVIATRNPEAAQGR